MNNVTRKAVEKEVVRLIPQAIYEIKKTYNDDSGYIALQDFFLAVPFEVIVKTVNIEDEKEKEEIYPSVLNYIGGYTKLVTDDSDSKYLKVTITVQVPDNIKTPGDGINWVRNNIINTKDVPGSTILLLVYMHEIMHIMHKHLMPSVNAKFDAIIKQYSNGSSIPSYMQHKIKNFAEDFIINALLIESASSGSELHNMKLQTNSGKKLAFLYNPELSPLKNHTVETVIVELMKNLEIDDNNQGQGQSGQGQSGQGQSSQGQSGQGQSGQGQSSQGQSSQGQSGQGQSGQGQSGQGQGQSGQGQSGQNQSTTYKLKYGDFEYTFTDNQQQGTCSGSSDSDNQDISQASMDALNQVANKLKGSGSIAIAAKLGLPITVTVDWLEKLESDLFKEVRYKTHKVSSTWSRLKNKYRGIAPLPATVNYENVLNAVLVIDQSGSVSNLELRKINYIIKKLVKRVKTLRVLIHDDVVTYDKTFKYNIDKSVENEVFNTRHACGGTSHKDAFDRIEKEFEKKTQEDFIVLVFSDMYSDIEQIWNTYKWTKKSKTYLIATDMKAINHISSLPVTIIDMETGDKI